jgi:hypothetical protein
MLANSPPRPLRRRRGGRRGDLINSRFQGASLKEANLEDVNLWDAEMARADLSGASLRRACLWGVWLEKANLSGTDLTDAYQDDRACWPTGFDPAARGVFYKRDVDWLETLEDAGWLDLDESDE